MASEQVQYDADDEISCFFKKTSVDQAECDRLAKDFVGGDITPVFRLRSLALESKTSELARDVYGNLAPEVSFKQQLGEAVDGKEPLLVYVMTRLKGMSHLDFILEDGFPKNSPENFARRQTLMKDVARFIALAWKSPQPIDPTQRNELHDTYQKELQQLLGALPPRFRNVVQHSLDMLPEIFRPPMVLLHKDFGDCNIFVDEACHLVGVVDWAEAEVGPFGTNLHSLQGLMSNLHLSKGWIRYEDYDALVATFWETFSTEVGGLDAGDLWVIQAASVVGLLRSRGFTSRLANMPEPQPINDDASGRYNMMILDGLLLNRATRFEGLGLFEADPSV
ncbi:Uu.00g065020.m01.CDS01 [Anthostomella pinea]|uniref:Uu.00g065020.m01.CDS01 n=1 Tax=Anthostomella pinea TaxID=933095 RepID=A0AAI8YKR0_9PEZI|nr:Uu.00g065020.m01.CDS01 [Anthostomella pinea]